MNERRDVSDFRGFGGIELPEVPVDPHGVVFGRMLLPSDFESLQEVNVARIAVTSVEELGEMFLKLTSQGQSGAILVCDDPSAAVQMKSLISRLEDPLKDRLREGIAMALENWTFEEHGYHVASELAYMAAMTRAHQAIDGLLQVVNHHRASSNGHAEIDNTDTIYSVVAGFSPDERIRDSFESMFFDDTFNQKLGGIIFNALGTCNPQGLARYVERLQTVYEVSGEYFRLDFLFPHVRERVGDQEFDAVLVELAPELRGWVEPYLRGNITNGSS